jgi:hypothetical protein
VSQTGQTIIFLGPTSLGNPGPSRNPLQTCSVYKGKDQSTTFRLDLIKARISNLIRLRYLNKQTTIDDTTKKNKPPACNLGGRRTESYTAVLPANAPPIVIFNALKRNTQGIVLKHIRRLRRLSSFASQKIPIMFR